MPNKINDIFDEVLSLLISFPLTILSLILRPSKVFGKKPMKSLCPPGATFLISLALYLWANGTLMYIGYDIQRVPEFSFHNIFSGFVITVIVILASVLLSLRTLLIHILPRKNKEHDIIEDIKILSYPVSLVLTGYFLLILFSINYPDVAMSLGTFFAGNELEEKVFKLSLYRSVESTSWRVMPLLLWIGLLYTCLFYFEAKLLRSIFTSLIAMILSFVIYSGILMTANHTRTSIENCYKKEKAARSRIEQIFREFRQNRETPNNRIQN